MDGNKLKEWLEARIIEESGSEFEAAVVRSTYSFVLSALGDGEFDNDTLSTEEMILIEIKKQNNMIIEMSRKLAEIKELTCYDPNNDVPDMYDDF